MAEPTIREPEEFRQDCARKLRGGGERGIGKGEFCPRNNLRPPTRQAGQKRGTLRLRSEEGNFCPN